MSKIDAKSQEENNDPSDRDPQASVGGVTAKMFEKTVKDADNTDEKLAKLRGDKSATLKAFEDAGGHKKALKVAMMIDGMEIANGRDFWRTLHAYLTHLGFFNQLDMFEKQELNIPDQKLTIKPGKTIQTAKPAEPKEIGAAQADAFNAAHAATH